MINKKVFNAGLATVLAASFATSASAGGLYEKYQDMSKEQAMEACPTAQFKKARAQMVDGVRVIDFTNQPEVCAARFGKTVSSKYQVVFAERQEQPWRTETVDAVREIQEKTGKTLIAAFYKDVDPDDKWAKTSLWSWGHEMDSVALEDRLGIDEDMVARHNIKEHIVTRGIGVQEHKNKVDANVLASRDNKLPVLAAN